MKRRSFLKAALATGALYSAGGLPVLGRFANAGAFATLGNPVLVDVMLVGGPDMRHLFPPAFNANTDSFGYRYWEAKAASHSIANSASAFQARWENDYFHVAGGQTEFGILKSCGWLKRMWDAGNVAIVNNAVGGTDRDHQHCQLVKDQGNLSAGHSDQNKPGWGGRVASAAGGNVLALTYRPRIFCYGPDAGNPAGHDNSNVVSARNTRKISLYTLKPGNPAADLTSGITRSLQTYYAAKAQEMDPASVYYRFIEHEQSLRRFGEALDERLSAIPLPGTISSLYEGTSSLSSPYFGQQIRNLHDAFAASDLLSMRVASLEYLGWDSHKEQKVFIEPKFQDMFGDGKGFDTLYQELPEDVKNNMVLVIGGEFGRQIKSNGANGNDHGRGNAIIIIGNQVNGGIYGDMFPEAELSRLNDRNPDILGLTSMANIFSVVSDWVSPNSSSIVFPGRDELFVESGVDLTALLT